MSGSIDTVKAVKSLDEKLVEAVETAITVAKKTHTHWDADEDSKVGKLVMALAGYIPGYRADVDAMHAALVDAKKPKWTTDLPKENGYYWWRECSDYNGRIVYVSSEGKVIDNGHDDGHCKDTKSFGGEWCGPIHAPKGSAS